jgi:hypothetical protein
MEWRKTQEGLGAKLEDAAQDRDGWRKIVEAKVLHEL